MANEEIITTVGMNLGGVDAGCKEWRKKTEDAAEGVHKSFVKVGSSARAFKNLLHETTAESPLMGLALRFALNPIVGLLGLATAAFKHFHDAIKETNAHLDAMGKFAAQKMGNMKDSLKEARREIEAENKEVQKWLKDQVDASQKVIEGLSHQLNLMESQVRISDKLLANEKERAIKMVHAQVASGQMTKEQGQTAEDSINKTASQRQAFNAYAGTQSEIEARKSAAQELRRQQAEIKAKINQISGSESDPEKRAKRLDLSKHLADAEKQLVTLNELKAGVDKSIEDMKSFGMSTAMDSLGDFFVNVLTSGRMTGPGQDKWYQAHVEQQSLADMIKTQQNYIEKARDSITDAKTKEDQRKARLADLGESYKKTGEHAHALDTAAGATDIRRQELMAGLSPEDQAAIVLQYTREQYRRKLARLPRNASDAQRADLTAAFKDVGAAYNYSKEVERAYGPGGKNLSDDVATRVQSLQDALSKILSNDGIVVRSIANSK